MKKSLDGKGASLAVVAPEIGVPSETFIRRHVEDLSARTVVVTRAVIRSRLGCWSVTRPVLELGRFSPSLLARGLHAAAPRLGWSVEPPDASAARRFLRDHGVGVILGEYLDRSLDWLQMARELGVPFFVHAHGYDVSRSLRSGSARAYLAYTNANGIIAPSRFIRQRLVDLGLDPDRIEVVPYGVDVPSRPVDRSTGEPLRCLAVGRMVGKKAPILTLDAFRRVAEKRPGVHLDMVGGGPLLPAAHQFVRAFGLEQHVTLHDEQSHDVVLRMMRQADVFVQHSLTAVDGNEEGLPVAILEAMASALPVVGTRHAGIPEAVQDGVTGYLVDEGDSAAMADRIARLLADPAGRREMGLAGWRRAAACYTWESARARLRSILGLDGPLS